MSASPGANLSPCLASRTSIGQISFRRLAKASENTAGICCVITMAGLFAGNRVRTASIASVPPVEAPIAMITGYTAGELDQGRYFTFNECPEKTTVWQQIRDRLDFAVMGRYNRLAPGTQPLRSSRNQKLHLFTARYDESDFGEQIVEVSIEENGAATITGFPVLGCPA